MQKRYFCYVYVYAQEFISNMIDKRYVPIPKEVDLCIMKGICEKFELKAVVQLYRKQHPLQFSTHTKQYPPEKTCLNFVFLLCLPLLY